ncbi:hypothetical protein [Diaphorobacter sp.]|uniref:DUF7665 family protein n=1 Tax=Diaphorobacter sp. TaxID=1934310 RepID=UPI002899FD05|nr:hypothetical protein [Diaphorobacter sp.]
MSKRIIVQSAFARDGLVLKVAEHASDADIKGAILVAIPPEHAATDLEVFDEADDDGTSRDFADNELLERGRIFHVGRCKQVQVTVRYAGRVVERRFPPVTRIGRILRWATKELGISGADANELVLQVAGSTTQPTKDQHVGSFVEAGTCGAVFDLVRSYTVNGDATLAPAHAALLAHLEEAPFLMGSMNGRWQLRAIAWPIAFFDVRARDGRDYTLRLDCAGYPQAPTGAFWDVPASTWLPGPRWPRAGSRFGAALRSDWQGGTALYVPCDRASLPGHEQWLQLHPAWAWDPKIGISRYLNVVSTMLNGEDYVAPSA